MQYLEVCTGHCSLDKILLSQKGFNPLEIKLKHVLSTCTVDESTCGLTSELEAGLYVLREEPHPLKLLITTVWRLAAARLVHGGCH